MIAVHAGDEFFWRDTLAFGTEHDRRAMGIIGADIDAVMAAQALVAGPDVRLGVLYEMPEVDGSVGIGECAGN